METAYAGAYCRSLENRRQKSGQGARFDLASDCGGDKDRTIAARTADNGDGITDTQIMDILAKMVKQRQEAATTYEEAGRLELAEQERAEIGVIEEFLPRRLDADEMALAVQQAIEEMEAASLKDMGKVMGALKGRYAGQMDFGQAGALVKEKLGG